MTEPKTQTEQTNVPQMDWEQVRLNGGPPCFAVGIDGDPMRCCGRAERWEGHGSDHEFVTLVQFVEAATRGLREQLEAAEAVIRHYGDEQNWGFHSSGVDGENKRQYVAICYEATSRGNGYDLAQEFLKKHGGE